MPAAGRSNPPSTGCSNRRSTYRPTGRSPRRSIRHAQPAVQRAAQLGYPRLNLVLVAWYKTVGVSSLEICFDLYEASLRRPPFCSENGYEF